MKKLDEVFVEALRDVEERVKKVGLRSASGLFDRAGFSRTTLDRWRAEVPRTIQMFARMQTELEKIEAEMKRKKALPKKGESDGRD